MFVIAIPIMSRGYFDLLDAREEAFYNLKNCKHKVTSQETQFFPTIRYQSSTPEIFNSLQVIFLNNLIYLLSQLVGFQASKHSSCNQ